MKNNDADRELPPGGAAPGGGPAAAQAPARPAAALRSPAHPFADDYAQARALFLQAAAARGCAVESHLHPLPGAQGETLAMDVARAGAADAPSLLVISSGTHGVEGFCGSACQVALLEDDELLRRLDGGRVALLLIHALNPWGFSHLHRVNEDNVDLNRNFQDFDAPLPQNPDYAALHPLLLPPHWPPGPAEQAGIDDFIARRGMAAFQAAVSGGQATHPDGLFHTGRAPVWSNRTLRAVLRTYGAGRRRIGWIDIHTGLGPAGHGEKIHTGCDDPGAVARARAWWGADVVSTLEGGSASAHVRGPAVDCLEDECPQAERTSIGLEFGTRPITTIIETLRADHWLLQHPQADPALRARIRAAMRDAFLLDDERWRGMTLGQARVAVLQAIAALS